MKVPAPALCGKWFWLWSWPHYCYRAAARSAWVTARPTPSRCGWPTNTSTSIRSAETGISSRVSSAFMNGTVTSNCRNMQPSSTPQSEKTARRPQARRRRLVHRRAESALPSSSPTAPPAMPRTCWPRLRPQQLDALQHQLDKDNRKFVREIRARRRHRRSKAGAAQNAIWSQITDWTGSLTRAQEQKITALLDGLPLIDSFAPCRPAAPPARVSATAQAARQQAGIQPQVCSHWLLDWEQRPHAAIRPPARPVVGASASSSTSRSIRLLTPGPARNRPAPPAGLRRRFQGAVATQRPRRRHPNEALLLE